MLGNIFGGANSTNSAVSNPVVGASAIPRQVPGGADRNTGVTLAQVPNDNPALQPAQATQAQSLEAQIKSLFTQLEPMKALNLLMELMGPFMSMLGMGPAQATAPAATKTEQASAPQTQTSPAQDPQTLQEIDKVMAQFGQGQTPQGQTPQTLQEIDEVMAQFGQGQAQQTQKDTPAPTNEDFTAMLQDLLANQMNQSPNNSTPTDSQPDKTVRLASNKGGILAPVLEKNLSKPA